MSDRTVTELVIDSNTAGAAEYERAMASAGEVTRRTSDAANDFTINLIAVGSGAVAAALLIKRTIDQAADVIKSLEDMAGLAERVGLSLRDLQGLQFGARIAGLTDGAINAGLEKSAQLLNDAQRNANSLSKQFEANGLSLHNSNGALISQNQLLQAAAEMIRRAASPQDAIAIAQMLGFTKEWVPFLRQGADTLRELGNEAERAGALIDDETVRRAEEFDRNWRRSSVEFSSYMKSALLGLFPVVDGLIDRAREFVKSISRKDVEKFAEDQLAALNEPFGLPQRGGLKIGITPETERAMRDWQDSNKSWTERLAAIVTGLRASVQFLSEDEVKWQSGSGQAVANLGGNIGDVGRWQAQADGWKKLSIDFLSGADQINAGFTRVASRASEANDAVDRAMNSLRRHTEQQLADAAAMGQGVAVQALFRAQAAETAAVQANGGKETAAQAAAFRQLARDAADAAVALERARVTQGVRFNLGTAFLSQGDVSIAQQLRGLYPDVATALSSVEASGLRAAATFREISNALETGLTTGLTDVLMGTKSVEKGFTDMGLAIVKAIDQAIVKILIVEPLMRQLQSIVSGLGFNPFVGGGSPEALAVAGGTAPVFHAGGVVGEPGPSRMVDPAIFAGARRFHGGGIVGDEVPIIARRGERVSTPEQWAAHGRGGGNVVVNVNNAPAGTTANVQTQRSSNGDISIDVMLDAIVAQKLGTPGTASNRMLTDRFGAAPRITGR